MKMAVRKWTKKQRKEASARAFIQHHPEIIDFLMNNEKLCNEIKAKIKAL
jgi:hypothetical protein